MKRLTVIIVVLVASLILLAEFTMGSKQDKINAKAESISYSDSLIFPGKTNQELISGKEMLVISKN